MLEALQVDWVSRVIHRNNSVPKSMLSKDLRTQKHVSYEQISVTALMEGYAHALKLNGIHI